jgi:hypothetical protein
MRFLKRRASLKNPPARQASGIATAAEMGQNRGIAMQIIPAAASTAAK